MIYEYSSLYLTRVIKYYFTEGYVLKDIVGCIYMGPNVFCQNFLDGILSKYFDLTRVISSGRPRKKLLFLSDNVCKHQDEKFPSYFVPLSQMLFWYNIKLSYFYFAFSLDYVFSFFSQKIFYLVRSVCDYENQ